MILIVLLNWTLKMSVKQLVWTVIVKQPFLKTAGECKRQRHPLRYGRRSLLETKIAYIKWTSPELDREAPTDLKTKTKKEPRREILNIGVSVIALAFTVFMISGFIVYRNHAWAGKRNLVNENFEFLEDIAPWSFICAELEKVTMVFKKKLEEHHLEQFIKGY